MSQQDTLTINEIRIIVENEGLEYSISQFISADSIRSKRLREAWVIAADAIQDIRNILRIDE